MLSSGAKITWTTRRDRARQASLTHHRRRLIEDATAAGLTPRQAECLALYTEGLTYAGVAFRLGVSVATIKTHMQSARDTLGATTTTEMLAIVAYRRAA